MVTSLILTIISLTIFVLYNAISLKKFRVPTSLSNTFYLWNGVRKHLGFVFSAMMFSIALTLLPAWLELGEVISSWSSNLNVVAFLACGSIGFVGAAPAFRQNEMESKVHTTSAIVAAVCSILWCLSVCWKIAYVPIVAALGILTAGICTKTLKQAKIYWLEMMAFGATFITVIVELLMHL
jgi:hypothetical protein